MRKFFSAGKISALILTVFTILNFSSLNADAQTKRRVKSHKKPTRTLLTAPTIIPNPAAGDAAIVSRADDFLNENRTLEPETIQPPQTETTETAANTPESSESKINALNARIKNLEAKPANEYDQKQKRLLLNLDILTRAETRAESLRKQLFDLVEKESGIKFKLDQIENDSRSENIDRAVAFAGTLRPEELRDMRTKNLESEKQSLETLLTNIQETKSNLELNVQRADALVEKLRTKLEKDIDDSLAEEPKN